MSKSGPIAAQVAATGSANARTVARLIGELWPTIRPYDDRDVRGIVRSDDAPVARLAESPTTGGNRAHVYQMDDVRAILAVVVARHLRRTGVTLAVPAPFGAAAPKRRAAARKSPKRAPVARSTSTAPVVPVVAPSGDGAA
jgi:hypothetical protein